MNLRFLAAGPLDSVVRGFLFMQGIQHFPHVLVIHLVREKPTKRFKAILPYERILGYTV